jgi:CDP-glycerol glycerophosphotransferase
MSGPVLSVVVPVHGVEPYLRQCLDSILREAGADVEVVAVDDVSPDGCPAILDEAAATDPRVRVLHLPVNAGLSGARNAGLDAATGRYVWFVDADDWLPAGSVPAVLAALRADDPDVLLLDHVRVHEPDGRVALDPHSRLLRGVTGAAPLGERPALLAAQHAAWNKVIRRSALLASGIRFQPGWYEDGPFSHALLIALGPIAVLDRVCYHYRQRAEGAITRTVSDRHFEAFDQYDRLMVTLDGLGRAAEPYRPAVLRLVLDHLLVIAGNQGRVPAARRGEFFRRIADFRRRHLPAGGYPLPGGVAGVKHRMLAADAFRAYATLRHAYRLLSLLPRARRGQVPPVPLPAPQPTAVAPAPVVPAPVVPAQRVSEGSAAVVPSQRLAPRPSPADLRR